MPSPYKTNCFDYNKIGCTSRQDCIEKCWVEWALIYCNNSLPDKGFIDKNNDKDKFTSDSLDCNPFKFCKEKYKSRDCFNEYYSFQVLSENKIPNDRIYEISKYFNESTFKSNNPNTKFDINSISTILIRSSNDPETIYTHSPQQYPIEFICFIGGVISLWTGFSVHSIYAYGKRFLRRNQNKVEELDNNNVIVNNHYHNHIHNHVN